MRGIIYLTIVFLILMSGCRKTNDCYNNASNTPNPHRGVFLGNYHFYFHSNAPSTDITITPAGNNGNWINISGSIYSTFDSTCTLNNECAHMSSGSTDGLLRGDTLFITEYSPDAFPPDFISAKYFGVKY